MKKPVAVVVAIVVGREVVAKIVVVVAAFGIVVAAFEVVAAFGAVAAAFGAVAAAEIMDPLSVSLVCIMTCLSSANQQVDSSV